MNTGKTYALLTGVGVYEDTGKKPLSCARKDVELMVKALQNGLKIDKDNIRCLGEDGTVGLRSFARSLSEFGRLLKPEDTFIYYFSGHGQEKSLCFTDGSVTLESIVKYIDALPAKSKLVILDCCYSGQAKLPEQKPFSLEGSLAAFAGSGIAVMASSSAEDVSWKDERSGYSLYTEAAAAAFLSRRRIRGGRLSLTDINEEIRYQIDQWNLQFPEKAQHPVYREGLVGTIFFAVEEYRPYVPQKIFFETDDYIVHHVKPLNTATQKRLAVFVILKTGDDSLVTDITRQIMPQVRYSDVYASAAGEARFRGKPVDVVWCYFGHDEEDLTRGNHFAYTIWTGDDKLRETYYRQNRNAEILDGIYVFWNTSYELVKNLQETTDDPDEIIENYKTLSNLLILHAESFIKDLEEAENGTISISTVMTANREWIREVKQLFFKLTSAEVSPIEFYNWAESILETAGWVVDMAVLLEDPEDPVSFSRQWQIKNAVKQYHLALERLSSFIEK